MSGSFNKLPPRHLGVCASAAEAAAIFARASLARHWGHAVQSSNEHAIGEKELVDCLTTEKTRAEQGRCSDRTGR